MPSASLTTPLTRLLGIRHPVLCAPLDLVTAIEPAAAILERVVAEATYALATGASLLHGADDA